MHRKAIIAHRLTVSSLQNYKNELILLNCSQTNNPTPLMRTSLLLLCFLAIFKPVFSQDKQWDIEKYSGTAKTFEINTDEGTWMNLDVSSDGKDIVFDLLGDIYVM